MARDYLVPFSAEPMHGIAPHPSNERIVVAAAGSLLHYAHWHDSTPSVVWRPPDPFTATLHLQNTVHSGRSAKYVTWEDLHTGRVYPMFIRELVTLVHEGKVTRGFSSGTWRPRKRGQNFGIEFVPPRG